MPEEKQQQETKKKTPLWKLLLRGVAVLAVLSYLVVILLNETGRKSDAVCKGMTICIEDSSLASFVSISEIKKILLAKSLNPVGVKIEQVRLKEMQDAIKTHKFVLEANCYKTADDYVHINVMQRLPVMRIYPDNGTDYYIDAQGNSIPKVDYPADVIIASGHITSQFAKHHLASIGKMLMMNQFWNSQVEQLFVNENGTIELIPRVGNHVVVLGSPNNIEEKLDKLKLFYEKVLAEVGWNKYSRVSMEYENQIVCTKTE